jgi:hypothetical protein
MAYAASNIQYNKNQLMVISLAMFGAIASAIVVSTLLVMTLMRGEFASAVNDINTNAPVAQTISAGSDVCTGTSTPQQTSAQASGVAPVGKKHWGHGSAVNSYNNTSTSTVTNNVSETNTSNTTHNLVSTITGSFNLGSYNQVASNNTTNSNNTIETNINPDNSVNVNSNNTTNVDSHDVDVDVEVDLEVEVEVEDSILVAL